MKLKEISAVLIVKNAAKTLKECLNSLKEFGEIVLLDNQSDDDTLQIAKDFAKDFPNIRIEQSEFIGFGALKNKAISYATKEWIFSIDADEVLEYEALKELEKLDLKTHHIVAFARKNLYRGEWIKACGWHPDFVLRLFHKSYTKFNDNLVHESLILPPNAEKIYLKNALRHYAYNGIYDLLEKCQRYSQLYAQQNLHKKSSMFKALTHGAWKFHRDYFLKKGIFYGYKGFIISLCNGLGAFFKYAKLYEAQNKKPSIALIITTYNSPTYLKAVLESVMKQNTMPNEILIADDGSTEETANLIKEFQNKFSIPLKHIWQEDKGYRLAKSRNNAVKKAMSEYIIIIDGDMVLEENFIKDHLDFAKKGVFLQGSRVILNEAKSQDILGGGYDDKLKRSFILSKIYYHFSKIRADFFNKKDFIKGVRGCNMSFFKSDFDAICGFNEKFSGWGREDSEFVARFLFKGGEFRRLKFKALAYHLYHKENDRACLDENHQLYLNTIKNKKISWREQ
ncbi:glycosyltransferase [Campylobacter upsaliensis]|uniref:glycosyltransferase family 2 protein n=1 Tax=Campylobacter upsaliensis TaxID=28080 RepID=UPI002B3DE28A|nr:glycosyltransferase [Campylobacter upsaliensis]MEB2790954.1 glycosyltransferase [Campylobacter upsaliensis]